MKQFSFLLCLFSSIIINAQCIEDFGTNFFSYENYSGEDSPYQMALGKESVWNGQENKLISEIANDSGSVVLDTLGIRVKIEFGKDQFSCNAYLGVGDPLNNPKVITDISFVNVSLKFDLSNYSSENKRITTDIKNYNPEAIIVVNNDTVKNFEVDTIQYLSNGSIFTFHEDSLTIFGAVDSFTLGGFEFAIENLCISPYIVTSQKDLPMKSFSIIQVDHLLIINADEKISNNIIRIYNSNGSLVYSGKYNNSGINISNLSSNIYFLNIGGITKKVYLKN
jgi:hypothetical protein